MDLKIVKNKRIPQILWTNQKQAAPRQVQNKLLCYPYNSGTDFRTQAAQHLVDDHLFKLPYALHIYNNQGKKENIDTLLMGGDSDTWWKSVLNELGRLANGIENQIRATNIIEFIRKGKVPRGCTFTYAIFYVITAHWNQKHSEPY